MTARCKVAALGTSNRHAGCWRSGAVHACGCSAVQLHADSQAAVLGNRTGQPHSGLGRWEGCDCCSGCPARMAPLPPSAPFSRAAHSHRPRLHCVAAALRLSLGRQRTMATLHCSSHALAAPRRLSRVPSSHSSGRRCLSRAPPAGSLRVLARPTPPQPDCAPGARPSLRRIGVIAAGSSKQSLYTQLPQRLDEPTPGFDSIADALEDLAAGERLSRRRRSRELALQQDRPHLPLLPPPLLTPSHCCRR